MYTKVKNILRTFEPDYLEMLRTSQPEKIFTGPYKKKRCAITITWIMIK